MTNGDKLKETFPNIQIFNVTENELKEKFIYIRLGDVCQAIELEWWNAEYKKPTTKNDLEVDCISREQAIKTIQRYGVGCFDADEFSPEECERFVIAKLNGLPSVTSIRSKGHWIWELDETPSTFISPCELNYAGWVCSCCHEFPDDICEWDNPDEPPTYKFCPHCGSDNREVEE